MIFNNQQMELAPEQFAAQLDRWYCKWAKANPRYFPLEDRLTQKANDIGYLEMADLAAITCVLGNPFNIRARVQNANTEDEIKEKTGQAIKHLDNPVSALEAMMSIKWWRRTYSSKTLRCICPRSYVALDSLLIQNISQSYLSSKNEVARYIQFIKLCQRILHEVSAPGPRRNNLWFLADVEIGLFQFVWDRGKIV